MIPLGLSAPQQELFEAQLQANAQMRVRVRMLDLSGAVLSDLTERLQDGQVNIDTTGDAERQASLTLDDPDHTLALDSSGPADGAVYADRMIRLDYGLYVEALARWVDVPIFTGPVVSMSRNGGVIELSCLGKEHLARGHCWRPLLLKKGMNTVAAIRTILQERAGERAFALPNVPGRLPGDVAISAMAEPWAEAKKLATGLRRHLYYDGSGYCRLRVLPSTSLFTFGSNMVLSDPQVSYDLSTIINVVWVKGNKPKGKPQVSGVAHAPSSHALSASRLGRSGDPRYLVELIEEDSVRSNAAARDLARRTLASRLLEGVTATFDALPVPHLDPLDMVRLATSDTSLTFQLHRASIPLTHSGAMSVGTTRRVTPVRRRR